MDDPHLYVLYISISVIAGRWQVDNERPFAMELRLIQEVDLTAGQLGDLSMLERDRKVPCCQGPVIFEKKT